MIAEARIPEPAASLYACAYALDAATSETDVGRIIDQGRAIALTIGSGTIPPGRASFHALSAGAMFMRSWAAHDHDLRDALLLNAQVLEAARDVAMLSVPGYDA